MSSRERANPDANTAVQVALRNVEIEAVNFAYRFVKDGRVREDYVSKAKAFSREVLNEYRAGRLSAKQAAEAAHQMRNEILEMARVRSSDLGRAKAADLKASGLDFDCRLSTSGATGLMARSALKRGPIIASAVVERAHARATR